MQEQNLRLRLKVLYVLISLLGAVTIVACSQTIQQSAMALGPSITAVQPISNPTETIDLAPSEMATQPPTLTDTPFTSPSSTVSPTPVCFHLLNPPDGSRMADTGIVKFEWEPHYGAQKYLLEITVPDGHMLAFDTFNTNVVRYMNTIPWEGIYTWQVAAMNAEGGVLCIVGPLSFSKPQFRPSLPPERNPPHPRVRDKSDTGGG
jgi:hypothetical protein